MCYREMLGWKMTCPCVSLFSLPVLGQSTIRWCTISEQEQKKCGEMSKSFSQASIRPTLGCVQANSLDDCVTKLQVGF